jgi:predicted NUDIX family NTP pyrophosphohydrolase
MYRNGAIGLEVLLVHPGGPFWRGKDDGAWTVPKGEAAEGEELLERARIEFQEELGFTPTVGGLIDLASIKQKGGKTVHAWAFAGDLPENFVLASNSFELEWPPRSGRLQTFAEVNDARFFSIPDARQKLNAAQTAFLDRLIARLSGTAAAE